MAVAPRQKVNTGSVVRRSPRTMRARTRRLRYARFKRVMKILMPVVCVAMLFGWVAIYANVTVTGYNRSKLTAQLRAERLQNERLKVECSRLSSPHIVTVAAEKAGMVYATQYDYIHQPQTVASADASGD
ncbi:hypothetical protein LLG46_12625 [bacterium]|nr:hypothetical protein [bacterium]